MTTTAREPALQRLQDKQSLRNKHDPVADELVGLGVAAAELISGLSDGVLGFHGSQLFRFLVEHGMALGLEPISTFDDPRGADLIRLLREYGGRLRQQAVPMRETVLDRQLAWLANTISLCEIDRSVLALFTRVSVFKPWRSLMSAVPGGRGMRPGPLGLVLGLPGEAIEARLEPLSPLLRSGMIVDEQDGDYRAGQFLRRIARLRSAEPAALEARMLPAAPPSTLNWADFDHLGQMRELASRAIAAAAGQGRGVNVLLHGVPGTGKSEFVRALAGRLGLDAIFAGLADDDGGEPTRRDRLAHLNVIRALTEGSRRHLIVVDEADDILQLPRETDRAEMSKLWLNRMVEGARTPTIWITNDPGGLGETIVRRMGLAIRFTLPPRHVRARVLSKHVECARIPMAPDEIKTVAALPVSPAVLAHAVDTAALAGGGGATIQSVGESILTALGGRIPTPAITSGLYDPALSNADRDLAEVAARLSDSKHQSWSMLLSGPSGTGKSAYARHLAERLGLEIHERRGSDLLSPYVGGTEANIAAAFTVSRDDGAMLLIDEVDSFLFSRQDARHSWERSMVNEMLRWMENVTVPFVATTNRADTLDMATQRRFALHIELQPLSCEQAAKLFSAYFSDMPVPRISELSNFTPGDFATVASRARILSENRSAVIFRWLVQLREDRSASTPTIGFGTKDF